MESLTDVCEYLDSIPGINQGGCAISMLAMYRWLKKEGKLQGDEAFVYMFRDADDTLKFLKAIKEGKTPPSCMHACLYTGGKYIDSTGEIPYEQYFTVKLAPEVEGSIVNSINEIENWNPYFYRDNIINIENTLNVCLEDVDATTWDRKRYTFRKVREVAKHISHPVADNVKPIIGITRAQYTF